MAKAGNAAEEAVRDLVREAYRTMPERDLEAFGRMRTLGRLGVGARTVALATAHMPRAIDLYRQSGMNDREVAAHLRRRAASPGTRAGE